MPAGKHAKLLKFPWALGSLWDASRAQKRPQKNKIESATRSRNQLAAAGNEIFNANYGKLIMNEMNEINEMDGMNEMNDGWIMDGWMAMDGWTDGLHGN